MYKRPLFLLTLLFSTLLIVGFLTPKGDQHPEISTTTLTDDNIAIAHQPLHQGNQHPSVQEATSNSHSIEQHSIEQILPNPSLESLASRPPSLDTPPTPASPSKLTDAESSWLKKTSTLPSRITWVTLKNGDSMARIFQKEGLKPATLHAIMSLGEKTRFLSNLHPGQSVEFAFTKEAQLLGLSVQLDALNTVWISRPPSETAFNVITETRTFEKRTASAQGTIKNSLFLTGQKVGLSEKTIMELANIFGWDIDFALDIRENDTFSILYEENMLDGEKHSDGAILAAEFTNAGRRHTAVRFEANGHADYYTKEGYSLRKAFLRSPVDFARISSHFNLRRRHPILHTIRAHKGVDYAAARGTPIKATGDGKVIHAARKGGYGRTVILQHGQKYTTLYAHLHTYARGIKKGAKVKQGQTIGYVGSSGLATGPHLHYEFRTNGVHVNPLTVKVPKSEPVEKPYRSTFHEHAEQLLAKLPKNDELTRYASTTLNSEKNTNPTVR